MKPAHIPRHPLRRLLAALVVFALLSLQAQWPAAAAEHAAGWVSWLAGDDGRDGEAPAPAGKTAVQAQVDQSDSLDPSNFTECAAVDAAWTQSPFASEPPSGPPRLPHHPPALAGLERPPRG